jgi:hypothetical protein
MATSLFNFCSDQC